MPPSARTADRAAEAAQAAKSYFDAVTARDIDAMVACWAPGAVDHMVGEVDVVAPDGVRAHFTELFGAFPDFTFEVVDLTAQDDRCAVRWRATGTFAGPGRFRGIEPTGARVELEGCDLIRAADGLVAENHAYFNGGALARQLGLLPPAESATERRMTGAFNARTRVARRVAAGAPERVADGVWLVRGGFPMKTMNVYFIEDEGGVTVFDAGIEAMTRAVATTAVSMGGIKRVVLGHGHPDHRGAAPGLGAPVFCHPADREDAEGDGGAHYFHFERLNPVGRRVFPWLLRVWDGGPVPIAGTVSEGDEVAGFEVVHIPGHAPGMIALWRASDRLALTSDCFYTLDPQTGIKGKPRLPHDAFNQDTEQARASIRKLAALEPAAAWPGHADPLTGDVRGALERAADTT